MKKQNLLLLALLLTILVSCKKESYRHLVAIQYPTGVGILYPDQQKDSVIFATFDSYSVSTSDDWITTTEPNINVVLPNSYYECYFVKKDLDIQPNTTGKCRLGMVNVRSYGDKWDRTATASYYQYGWHDIHRPSPNITVEDFLPVKADFELKDSATCVVDTIRFRAYDSWKLEVPQSSFISSVSRTEGYAGNYAVILNYDPNTKYVADTVSLMLTSTYYDIKTPIKIIRKGLPKE